MADLQILMNALKEISLETNIDRLFEQVLDTAMQTAGCDAGTLYLVEDDNLYFAVSRNNELPELNGKKVDLPPIPIGSEKHLCSLALQNGIIHIADAYDCDAYDLSGPMAYDARTGYLTESVLVVPVVTRSEEQIGVLQLINCIDEKTGYVCPFSDEKISVTELLARQLSLVLQNARYEQKLSEMKASLASTRHVKAVEEDDRSGLTAYINQNYHAGLQGRELDQAIAVLTQDEKNEQKVRDLKKKKERRSQDDRIRLKAVTDEEIAQEISAFAKSRKQPKLLDELRRYIVASGMSDAEIALRANIHKSSFCGMVNGKRSFTKYNLIATAFALNLRSYEVERLLQLNGMAFQGSLMRDVVLQYFTIRNDERTEPYDVLRINEVLYDMGLELIGTETK